MTSLLNPKAYLFMLAVYPQFLKPEYGPIWAQAVVMAVLTAATQFAVYGGLALAGSSGRDWLAAGSARTARLGRGAGIVLIAVAVVTAWRGLS